MRNGQFAWLRRACFAGREYAWCDPSRTDLFAPASSSLINKMIPSVFQHFRQDGWNMASVDISDAYLSVAQPATDNC